MKNYREVKFEKGDDGKWQNPVTNRESVSMAEHHATDANTQFVNTGIKYELLAEQTDFVVLEQKEPLAAHHIAGTPVAPLLNEQLHAVMPNKGAEGSVEQSIVEQPIVEQPVTE